MHIRNETSQDQSAIHALNAAAFETDAEARLVDVLRLQAQPLVSLVAIIDDAVVGHILFSPVRLTEQPDVSIMGLAPMAVAASLQKTGIGSELVKTGLAQCKALGFGAVAVLGHPDYYPRFGFVASTNYSIGCEYEVPDEVFMIKELSKEYLSDKPGLIQYHPAFNAL